MPEDAADFQEWAAEWYANMAEKVAGVIAPGLIKIDTLGGGGVSISDIGTVVTAAAFAITYRHKRGDPRAVS
jgi:N-acetylglucosamine-6-phosphate deacetylase